MSDTQEGLRLCLFDVDLFFAVPLLGHSNVFVFLPSVGHDRTMRRAQVKTRIERYCCIHILEMAVCIIEADCERRPLETRLLRMMCAITRLRQCAHDVCLRFGRTSCGRSSATQICKLSRKDWVFVEAIGEGQVHHSPPPPRMGARTCLVRRACLVFLFAVQMNYDTSLRSPTARYSQ